MKWDCPSSPPDSIMRLPGPDHPLEDPLAEVDVVDAGQRDLDAVLGEDPERKITRSVVTTNSTERHLISRTSAQTRTRG